MLCCFRPKDHPSGEGACVPREAREGGPGEPAPRPNALGGRPGAEKHTDIQQPQGSGGLSAASEPWRTSLLQHLNGFATANRLSRVGCWVLSEDRGTAWLLASGPALPVLFRSAHNALPVGSSVVLGSDSGTSVATAIRTKAPVSLLVPPGGHASHSAPPDLRQLHRRLGRLSSNWRHGHLAAGSRQFTWHLATLPLVVNGDVVGALVVAGTVDEAAAADAESSLQQGSGADGTHVAAGEGAVLARLEVGASRLAEAVFGTQPSRISAYEVCALAAAAASAPDPGSAMRDGAERLEALLQRAGRGLPRLRVALGLALSKTSGGTGASNTGSDKGGSGYSIAASVAASGASAASCACAASAASGAPTAATAATTGPQVQLFCTPRGEPPVLLSAQETLFHALARVDSSPSFLPGPLAAAAGSGRSGPQGGSEAQPGTCLVVPHVQPQLHVTPQPHQQRPQRLLGLRCPEEELPPQHQRADLAALDAAGFREANGSVAVVSCPLPNSGTCAVHVYVCVAAPTMGTCMSRELEAAQALDAGATGNLRSTDEHGVGGTVDAAARGFLGGSSLAPQLSEAQLGMVVSAVSSLIEVLAGCLEQRLAPRRVLATAASPRHIGRELPEQDLGPLDKSGVSSLSTACSEDVEASFWGSASGLDLSSETALTLQGGGASRGPASASSVTGSMATRLLHQAAFASTLGLSRGRPSNLSAVRPTDVVMPVAARDSDAESALMTTAHSELLFSACQSGGDAGIDGPLTEAVEVETEQKGSAEGAGEDRPGGVDTTDARGTDACMGGGGVVPATAAAMSSSATAVTTHVLGGIPTEGFHAFCAALEQGAAMTTSAVIAPSRGETTWAAPEAVDGCFKVGGGDVDGDADADTDAAVPTAGNVSPVLLPGPDAAGHGKGLPLQQGNGRAGSGVDVASGPPAKPGAYQSFFPSACGPHPVLERDEERPRRAGPLPAHASWPEPDSLQQARGTAAATAGWNSAGIMGRLLADYTPDRAPQRPTSGGPGGQCWPAGRAASCASAHVSGSGSSGGGGGSAHGSRWRATDCCDQASDAQSSDMRLVPVHGGSCSRGASSGQPRVLPVRVLSLDKAAQQLQRALPPTAPGYEAVPLPAGSPSLHKYRQFLPSSQPQIRLQREQKQAATPPQQCPQQQPPLSPPSQRQPQQRQQQRVGEDTAVAPHRAWPSQPFGLASTSAAAAPPPARQQLSSQPRRLTRMYLPPSVGTGAPAAGATTRDVSAGLVPCAAVAGAGAARSVAESAGLLPSASGGSAWGALRGREQQQPYPGALGPHAISRSPGSAPFSAAAAAARGADSGAWHSAAGAAFGVWSGPAPPLQPPRSAPPAVPQQLTQRPPSAARSLGGAKLVGPEVAGPAALPAPAPASAAGGSVTARQLESSSPLPGPSFAVAAAAAAATPSGAHRKAPSRQLSDFAIPEHEPLESTVPETVAMMRMLSQARGAHLSSRLRRVRVTAKIQSAHPESLPPDLPARIANAALGGGGGAAAGASGAGMFGAPGAAGARPWATWVLTGVAARRGCVELVLDVVQVDGDEGGGQHSPVPRLWQQQQQQRLRLPRSSPGERTSAVPAAAERRPPVPARNRSYRRWQSAASCPALVAPLPTVFAGDAVPGIVGGAPTGALPQGLAGWEAACCIGGGGAAAAPAAAGEEERWLRDACGLRPEAVCEVLQQCGLLSPEADPWLEVQVGHAPGGAATLLWDEARGQWAAEATLPPAAPAATGGGSVSPAMAPPGPPISSLAPESPRGWNPEDGGVLEAPTLWLPSPVAVLADGSQELRGVRVAFWGPPPLAGESDELLVRSSFSYLPCRATAAPVAASGGGGAFGTAVGSHPERAAVGTAQAGPGQADNEGRRSVVDISGLGATLSRAGGRLLVECRRTGARAADGVISVPGGGAACAARSVTSPPVPLLVLPSRFAAAGGELRCLSRCLAKVLIGPGAPSPAEASAQVEMACQQFLMDLGTLLDASAALDGAMAGAGAGASGAPPAMDDAADTAAAPTAAGTGAVMCQAGGGDGPLCVGFEEGLRSLLHSCEGAGPYRQHLLDVACTLLAGCLAAGLHHTTALVLQLACAAPLGLAPPQLLLTEAGADPQVAADIMAAFSAASAATAATATTAGGRVTSAGMALPATGAVTVVPPEASWRQAAAAAAAVEGRVPAAQEIAGDSAEAAEWGTSTCVYSTLLCGPHSHSHSLVSAFAAGQPRTSAPGLSRTQLGQPQQVAAAADPGPGLPKGALPQALPPVWQEAVPSGSQAATPSLPEAAGGSWRGPGVRNGGGEASEEGPEIEAAPPVSEAVCGTWDCGPGPDAVGTIAWQSLSSSSPRYTGKGQLICNSPPLSHPHGREGSLAVCGTSGLSALRSLTAANGTAASLLGIPGNDTGAELAAASWDASAAEGDCDGAAATAAADAAAVAAAAAVGAVVAARPGSRRDSGPGGPGPWWALRFADRELEAEYWPFVAERTCGMIWTYFLCVSFISAVSCARAAWEDGLPGFVSLLFFSGGQAAIMGWFCLARGGRDPRAMVAAGMACKALRAASVLLMGVGVLAVPSLMEPMAVRGVEVFAEAVMRPIAERVPLHLFGPILAIEMPCVWLLYRHFYVIYPSFWMRSWPLLRTLLFDAVYVLVHAAAEFYWRREFRLWRCRLGEAGRADAASADVRQCGGAIGPEASAHKTRPKEE